MFRADRSLLRLALCKQCHRTVQEVLLNIHDACLIYFLNQTPVFKIIVKIPLLFKETENNCPFNNFLLHYISKDSSKTI